MDAFGNWVIPGTGEMYKTYQDRKTMKDIASPQELAAMEKEDDRRYYNMLQEDPLREADYSEKLEETQTTPDEQLELFKLMEKQKAAEYYNQQRRKGERAELAEESTDTFSDFRDYAAASGGRVGFDTGDLVGSPTKEVTQFDRRIYKTPEGEEVSEISKTLLIDGKWINVPSIHGGKQFEDADLETMLMQGVIQPTSIHSSREEAEAAAAARSNMMKRHIKGFDQGGRVGFDEGSKPKSPSKRLFLKGLGALAVLPVVGKFFKLGKVLEAGKYTGPAIEKIKGMPEWFPSLVKKLFNEGEDVTKKMAVKERQIVKKGTLEDGDEVNMYYDMDTGDVNIEVYNKGMGTSSGSYYQPYALRYKKGQMDETTKGQKPPDEFSVDETELHRSGPEPDDIEFYGNETSVDGAISDLTELEAFAKNKTTKQIHKKKGTKPKDVNPEEMSDLDWDDIYDPYD
jgi:hypothetical protein